jgi:hypothetical protein
MAAQQRLDFDSTFPWSFITYDVDNLHYVTACMSDKTHVAKPSIDKYLGILYRDNTLKFLIERELCRALDWLNHEWRQHATIETAWALIANDGHQRAPHRHSCW